jgi:hypothetical protein
MFPSEKLFHLGPLRPEKHEKKKHKERKKELQMRLREMKPKKLISRHKENNADLFLQSECYMTESGFGCPIVISEKWNMPRS